MRRQQEAIFAFWLAAFPANAARRAARSAMVFVGNRLHDDGQPGACRVGVSLLVTYRLDALIGISRHD